MKQERLKGFTLIEILIASTIFAVIMVMATGVFSMTSSYSTKIREMRNVMNDARSVMMQISDAVRLSKGTANIVVDGATPGVAVRDIFLINVGNDGSLGSIFKPSGSSPLKKFSYGTPTDADTLYALGVVENNSDTPKVILYVPEINNSNFDLRRAEFSIDTNTGIAVLTSAAIASSPLINNGTSLNIKFSGYMLPINSRQPFVNIGILAQSVNYDTLTPNYRSSIELMTSVESRDYN